MSDSLHSPDYRAMLARLKEARASAGLTQSEVARLLQKPQSYVSKIESGERRLDIIELKALARIYRQPMDSFVQ